MTAPQVHSMFETLLIVDSLPDHVTLNRDLAAAIQARRKQDPAGIARSNQLGWHSDTAMIGWGGPAFRTLIERVVANANANCIDLAAAGSSPLRWFTEAWANISVRGSSNQSHSHAGAFWSAVYYVDDGYGESSDRALGGELELEDPRMPMLLAENPDLRFRPGPDWAIAEPERIIRPVTGRLLMFPGWLRHGVTPYLGNRERISIAINLTAHRPAS